MRRTIDRIMIMRTLQIDAALDSLMNIQMWLSPNVFSPRINCSSTILCMKFDSADIELEKATMSYRMTNAADWTSQLRSVLATFLQLGSGYQPCSSIHFDPTNLSTRGYRGHTTQLRFAGTVQRLWKCKSD